MKHYKLIRQINFIVQRIKTMDYIMNPNFLEIHSHSNYQHSSVHSGDTLYYQWQAKNIKNKIMQQRNRLKVMLEEIILNEKQREMQIYKRKQIQLKNHQRDQNKDFYDYNIQWKQKIDSQVEQKRNQIKQMKIKSQQQEMNMNTSQYQYAQNSTENNKRYMRIRAKQFGKDCQHKGPILGWQQHFNDYMRSKNPQNFQCGDSSQELFHPKINKKSQRITRNFNQPVEQRLISYGQKLKIKKQQFQQQLQNQMFPFKPKTLRNKQKAYHNGHQTQAKTTKNDKSTHQKENTDIYSRLYKQAQNIMYNRVRNELKTASLYQFKPQINKNTEQLQLKVKTIRQNRPLYSLRPDHMNNHQNDGINKNSNTFAPIGQQTRTRSYMQMETSASSQSFKNFLRRNQQLLKKKKKLQQQKQDVVKKEEDQMQKKCTFSPSLNSKSIKIFQSRIKQLQQNKRIRGMKFDSEADTKIQTTERMRVSGPVNSFEKIYRSSSSGQQTINKGNTQNQMPNDSLNQQSSISDICQNSHAYSEQHVKYPQIKEKSYKLRQQSSYYGETIGQLNEEDSIQKIRQSEWQSQIKTVQNKIEEMMKRALKS